MQSIWGERHRVLFSTYLQEVVIPPDPFSAHDIACRGRDRGAPVCRCRRGSRSDRFAASLGLVLIALAGLTTMSWSTGATRLGAETTVGVGHHAAAAVSRPVARTVR